VSLAAFAAVVLAGAAGGVARAWLSWAVARVVARPGAGTTAVNLLGAFLAGVVVGGVAGDRGAADVATGAAVGFLGAFTTFSTWMVELHGRWRVGARAAVALEAIATLGAGVVLAMCGAWLVA
jgi:CrcB protein